jgi:glycine/D-amino acid oxidase-like deaminating enzyme
MSAAMSMRADVIVVGAGSSGAAVSAFLAERGLRVVCLERRG